MSFSLQKGFITDKYSSVSSAVRVLVSDNPVGEKARCGVPGPVWLHVYCGCEAGGRTAKFSKTTL
jgi:hypothetical protein